MSEYRRNKQEGGVFFFTVVTFHRKPILTGERERCLLRAAWKDVEKRFPFKTVQSVRDWPWSSFHRYVREGLYEADWGTGVEETLFVSDYGE
jgi:hypothetical protein